MGGDGGKPPGSVFLKRPTGWRSGCDRTKAASFRIFGRFQEGELEALKHRAAGGLGFLLFGNASLTSNDFLPW